MKLRIFIIFQALKRYRHFFLIPLYFIFIFYECLLFAEEEKKCWNASASFGLGYIHYMDGFESKILNSKISLLVRPIDFSNNVEAKFTVLTQSPLREDDGFIAIPLREYSFTQISELWIRDQIFKNLELKAGIFPDTPDETTPISWPYYSLYAKIDFLNNNNINFYFLARQDIFSVYSSYMNSSSATNIERSHVELDLNSYFEFEKNKISIKIKSVYNQFSDPDFALSSLSIGRGEYIDQTVTYHDQKYHIADINGELSFTFHDFLTTKLASKYWKNLSAVDYNNGYIFGFEESIHYNDTRFALSFWKFAAAQSSIPPSLLSSYYYSGFQINSYHFSLVQKLSNDLNGILEYRRQFASPYGQSPDPELNTGLVAIIPKFKVYFILEYAFDAL
jgi:hypothetical protein